MLCNAYSLACLSLTTISAACLPNHKQAHQAQEACLAALLVSVTPGNSLSILEYATSHGLEELALRAFESALGSFQEAAKSEPMTLAQLSPDTLLSLLQHDDLPVRGNGARPTL